MHDAYNQAVNAFNWYIILYVALVILIPAIIIGTIAISMHVKFTKSRKRQAEINANVFNYLKTKNFVVTSVFRFSDNATWKQHDACKKMVAVDDVNKKIAFILYPYMKIALINYVDFINYEIYENASMVTTGGVGFNIFGMQTSGQCKDLRLIIRINSTSQPQIAYDVISHTLFNIGLHKNSNAYRTCVSGLQELASFLEVIKKANNDKQKA